MLLTERSCAPNADASSEILNLVRRQVYHLILEDSLSDRSLRVRDCLFDFALGFLAEKIDLQEVMQQVYSFVEYIYTRKKDPMAALADVFSYPAPLCEPVLVTSADACSIVSGISTSRPWGLTLPSCPKCRDASAKIRVEPPKETEDRCTKSQQDCIMPVSCSGCTFRSYVIQPESVVESSVYRKVFTRPFPLSDLKPLEFCDITTLLAGGVGKRGHKRGPETDKGERGNAVKKGKTRGGKSVYSIPSEKSRKKRRTNSNVSEFLCKKRSVAKKSV